MQVIAYGFGRIYSGTLVLRCAGVFFGELSSLTRWYFKMKRGLPSAGVILEPVTSEMTWVWDSGRDFEAIMEFC